MPLPLKHFYMIRHGETEANKARLFAGQIDSPLTDEGRAQAARAGRIITALTRKPRVMIHTNLSRTRETASIINQSLNLPTEHNEDLREMHVGDWEGRPYEECQDFMGGRIDPPNGETLDVFHARIRRGKTAILNNHDSPALIVSHGGIFRGMARLYGVHLPPAVIKNCCLYEFEPVHSRAPFPWKVWSHDDVGVREKNTIFSNNTKDF